MIFEAHDKTVGWYKQSTYEAKEYNPRHLPVIQQGFEFGLAWSDNRLVLIHWKSGRF